MRETWSTQAPGVLTLPSGRLIRGRGLRRTPATEPLPDFGLCLLGREPEVTEWETRWVRWREFWLPHSRHDMTEGLREAWSRAATQRVEVVCAGGRGRTGTALACIAVLDGVPAHAAVAFVRERYDPRAVETPWQRRYVMRFSTP